jgi:acetyl-CoA carboxylase biotin carboxyl carrier protein
VRLEDGDFKITIRTQSYIDANRPAVYAAPPAQQIQMPVSTVAAPISVEAPISKPVVKSETPASDAPAKGATTIEIKSPMVGTFYRSAGPGKPAFVQVGDKIEKGKAVCIIEAMKLFNEVESEIVGTVVKVLVEDASPVEYDQPLFLVEI